MNHPLINSVRKDIPRRLAQLKRRAWLRRVVILAAFSSGWWMLSGLFEVDRTTYVLVQTLAALVLLLSLPLSRRYRVLKADAFCQHLNRRFDAFEESAQLLLQPDDSFSGLRLAQRQRVLKAYKDNIGDVARWLPPAALGLPLLIVVATLGLHLFEAQLRALLPVAVPTAASLLESLRPTQTIASLDAVSVRVEPPAYTGLESVEHSSLDLVVPEGSRVNWLLSLSKPGSRYELHFSGGKKLAFRAAGNGLYMADSIVSQTGLYRIVELSAALEQSLEGVYSLTVNLDKAPRVRITTPVASSVEIARDANPEFDSVAWVSDDFGISNVHILASVASGSGEGVKFRDEVLTFDQHNDNGTAVEYRRHWDLRALGMEPGDEIYFQVVATDNRAPDANTGRSGNVIVRWLDDESLVMAADGILIDWQPEYFKSQRQIIIETEQLLETVAALSGENFAQSAYSLGFDQASLKEKYGQYLGDELAPENPLVHNETATERAAGVSGNVSLGELIQRYGHNHGQADIGPITQRNPVGLMKRAVGFMWQAERHLLQAEPEQALPFEYEALKYLKLAQQADRIYTRRLGFEPPPVSEQRRLKGELDEVLSYASQEKAVPGLADDQFLLRSSFKLLSTQQGARLGSEQQQLLQRLSERLTAWSRQHPALIQQAATVERLLTAGELSLSGCADCLDLLLAQVWDLLDPSAATARAGRRNYFSDDAMIGDWQRITARWDAQP